jgi:hypothetical protein
MTEKDYEFTARARHSAPALSISSWPTPLSKDMRALSNEGTPPGWFGFSVLLLLVAAIYSFSLPITDIRLYDETSYLQGGVGLFEAPPDIETGPLYVAWYWLLSLIVPNHVVLYYVSWGALVALCLILPYAIERRYSSLVYACVASILPFYAIWPYINLFTSAIILASLCWLDRRHEKSYVSLSAGLLLTCCVAAFVRPEFHNTSYFCAALLIGAVVVEKHVYRHRVILIISIVAFVATEFVFTHWSGLRSGIAFAAYDDWIRFKQGRLLETPRTLTNAYQLYGVGEDATVLDFLKANPGEFWSHVLFNITQLKMAGLLALGMLAAVLTCFRLQRQGASFRVPLDQIIPLAVVYLPAVAANIIIYPKPHYFVIPYLVSVYYIARCDIAVKILGSVKAISALAVLAVISVLANFEITRGQASQYRMLDVIGCVRQIQSAHGIDHGPVLEALGGLSTYLEGKMTWVRHYGIHEGETVDAYIARTSPVIIVSDDELFQYYKQKGNLPATFTREGINTLIRNSGYEISKCGTAAPEIFVAKNLPARRF